MVITLDIAPYPIYLGNKLLTNPLLAQHLQAMSRRVVVISDSTVALHHETTLTQYLHMHGLSYESLQFPAGEQHKTRETKAKLEDTLLARAYGRDTVIIALGGGVVLDLVGFLAATYARGVPVIYMPTSLLAMVDATLGGKTGVNTPAGKNLIGAFQYPNSVFIDVAWLSTLPAREYHAGIAEVIKHAVIANITLLFSPNHPSCRRGELRSPANLGATTVFTGERSSPLRQDPALSNSDITLLDLLETQSELVLARDPTCLLTLIERNLAIKANIVNQDPTESGLRQILNFGHTVGHAIEKLEHYQISHGEAVAIGILVETYIAVTKGLLKSEQLTRLQTLLMRYHLPLTTIAFNDKTAFLAALTVDKKNKAGHVYMVLLDALGHVYHEENQYSFAIAPALLEQAWDWGRGMFYRSL